MLVPYRAMAFVLAFGAMAAAADRPVGGDRLVLKDPAGRPQGRAFKFKAARDPAVAPADGPDPRSLAATLEVLGGDFGDGSTGSIALPASSWAGLGDPEGSKGYSFTDRTRAGGIRTARLRAGASGGLLAISGGGGNWPYAITQSQGTIDVRLTLGSDVYCARFADFDTNEPGRVTARSAAAPNSCSGPLGVCGDGTVQGHEECDDGGTVAGDGCSATCTLESAAALCAGVPVVAGTGLGTVAPVTGGLSRPVHVAAAPLDPNRLFVVEQDGRIRIVRNGVLLPTPFLDVTGSVSCCGERGLLSVAFHPDYRTNGLFFVDYTNGAGDTEIRRFQVSANPDVANPAGTLVLMVQQDFSNHNGGQLAFGPDGYLYVGMGDGGSGGDPNERAQDPGQLLGKLLRLEVDAPTYAIPPTNPFAGPGLPLDEIWAMGVRNPWRFSFDRGTGDLYVGDVGQGSWEEIDVQPASSMGGENYGWDVFEGNACFDPPPQFPSCPVAPTGFTFPVLAYDHGQGCSVTGGFVYRGCRMPDLHGTYFYADYCSSFVRTFTGVAGGAAQNPADRTADVRPAGGFGSIVSFGEDARGEILVVDYGNGSDGAGKIWRIVPGP